MTNESLSGSAFDIQSFLKTLTSKPGVYKMINVKDEIIYVGKARNLKKRVSSYFTRADQTPKTLVMVGHIERIEVITTHTEKEALILENNLIKSLKPQYNIYYRDDKSYPYIYLTADKDYPRLSYYRGARKEKGRFFGPYPSAGAVRETLNLLQKLFPVRQCEDSFFKNRSRPCLQYQIRRCSAPCVDLINAQDYAVDVQNAVLFLEGKSSEVIDSLVERMEQASEQLKFEDAGRYRDQVAALKRVQEKQYVSASGANNVDVLAVALDSGAACVQVFYIRDGQNLGNKTYFPKVGIDESPQDLLSAFLTQHYLGNASRSMPNEILTHVDVSDDPVLLEALSEQAQRQVKISTQLRGQRARWLDMAMSNAQTSLASHLVNKSQMLARFESLQDALELDVMPQRLECFDISHTQGEETVASCVVFDLNGPLKSDYRRFNIKDITPGDDYAAMQQALTRRYQRIKEGEGKIPDVLFIDGGKGQLSQAESVMQELQIEGLTLVGVAKGVTRKPGMETLFLSGKEQPYILAHNSLGLHLIQQIRDEAHRFAITGHRLKRGKKRQKSILEDIPGLGPKRRQQLLKQFGGIQGIERAGVEDLCLVKGISRELAQKIYDCFHAD